LPPCDVRSACREWTAPPVGDRDSSQDVTLLASLRLGY
jgi:hypothetical protein